MPHEEMPDWQKDALERLRQKQGVPTGADADRPTVSVSIPVHRPEMGGGPASLPEEKRGVAIIGPDDEPENDGTVRIQM